MKVFSDELDCQPDLLLTPCDSPLLLSEESSESSSTIDSYDNSSGQSTRKRTTRKERWTEEEDSLLRKLVAKHGVKNWQLIARSVPGRCGKQCRQRWCNYLDPSIKKKLWTPEEDAILLALQRKIGNRWSVIKLSLPGRSENDVKNRYHCIHSRLYPIEQPKNTSSSPNPSISFSLQSFNESSSCFQNEFPLSEIQFCEQLREQEPLSFSGSECLGSSHEFYDPSYFLLPGIADV